MELTSLTGLAKSIVLNNLLNENQVIEAIEKAKKSNALFVNYLSENHLVDAKRLAMLASNNFGIPLLNIADFNLENIPHDLIQDDFVKKHNVLPLYKHGTKLFVAVSDPSNLTVLDRKST